MEKPVFVANNQHVDIFPMPTLGTEETTGFKSYFEGAYGDQWIAVAEKGRFRISGGDIGWKVIEVVNPDYTNTDRLYAQLNLVLDIPEKGWIVAVMNSALFAYHLDVAPQVSGAT